MSKHLIEILNVLNEDLSEAIQAYQEGDERLLENFLRAAPERWAGLAELYEILKRTDKRERGEV